MPRYVAFLRGVSPMNAKMPELQRCFERAGFGRVKTLLSSGNVAFDSASRSTASLERKAESAMAKDLERSFLTHVRRQSTLQALIEADPFAKFDVPAKAKRVITFLRTPPTHKPALPIELREARILGMEGLEVFCVYVPGDRGPVFMSLLERTFGKDITTRTWDTVEKCARA